MDPGPIRLLHISDLHLVADPGRPVYGQLSDASLEKVLESSARDDGFPDAVIATGDITDDSSPEGYRRGAELLMKAAPQAYWIPGNHDSPALMVGLGPSAFPAAERLGGWEIFLLDTSWAGHDDGRLGAEQTEWLDAHLVSSEEPAIVALHHPPLAACGSEECQLSDADELVSTIDRHGRVRAVLSGHNHRPFDRALGHAVVLGAPSTCRQLHHESPMHAWTNEPPGARFLTLHPDGTLDHHLSWSGSPSPTPQLEWW